MPGGILEEAIGVVNTVILGGIVSGMAAVWILFGPVVKRARALLKERWKRLGSREKGCGRRLSSETGNGKIASSTYSIVTKEHREGKACSARARKTNCNLSTDN